MTTKKRSNDGRRGRTWSDLAKAFRAKCEEADLPCWLCGQAIHWEAKPDEPDCFNVDHFYPVSTHPELGNDPANLRPSHRACNLARGNKDAPLSIGSLSEDW